MALIYLFTDTKMFSDSWWLQPYVPHSLTQAALILADHVDFWEEEAFRNDGWYRPRELTDFIATGSAADVRLKHRFRQLLEQYMELALQSNTVSHTADQDFHAVRRCNVQIAISNIRMWLDSEGMVVGEQPTPAVVGCKRPRAEMEA